jgi:4-hydroxy-3-methylbut-2-en-1-yl diphosphate reductase
MKILLANPRGFCAGVNSAIGVVNEVLDICGPPIWVYHEIVHNQHVVERFRDRGVHFVESLAEAPEGAIVVFSAHGVGPAVRREAEQRRLRAIDATCPLVTKVHMEVLRYARQGFQILFIGHNGHDEVVGTVGEAPEAIQVVESPEDIPNLDIRDPTKLVFLMQTTLSVDDAETIVAALRRAFPDIHEPPSDDICYATTNRQQAVRQIAPECDLVVVVGSQNSSNSVRLTEIAESQGTNACLVDDVKGLDLERLSGEETVLVTAGASAPEDLVEGIVLALYERFGGEVEPRDVFEETVEFDLPSSLKSLLREHDVDPAGRKIVAAHASLHNGLYAGAVPLTVSAASPRQDSAAP